jgi:hypothetical protein
MCERSPKCLTRPRSSVEIKENVTEPEQLSPVTPFESPGTSGLSVFTLSPVSLISWFLQFPEGNASLLPDKWLAKHTELEYGNKLLQKVLDFHSDMTK